jgi:uncharacterized protein
MSEHPNVAIARETYVALAKGDVDYIRDRLLADDVVFHVPGRGALVGDYRGKDEVVRYLTRYNELTGGSIRLEPEEFLSGENHVAALVHARGERGGRVLDDRGMHLFRISNGKIGERWSYPQDPYTTDEFFA